MRIRVNALNPGVLTVEKGPFEYNFEYQEMQIHSDSAYRLNVLSSCVCDRVRAFGDATALKVRARC